MKPYDDYGAEYRRAIRRLYDNHPEGTRVNERALGMYDALVRDGWAAMMTNKAATITAEGMKRLDR